MSMMSLFPFSSSLSSSLGSSLFPLGTLDETNKLMDRLVKFNPYSHAIIPMGDTVDNGSNYTVTLELPGISNEDITVTVEGRLVTVSSRYQSSAPVSSSTTDSSSSSSSSSAPVSSSPSSSSPSLVSSSSTNSSSSSPSLSSSSPSSSSSSSSPSLVSSSTTDASSSSPSSSPPLSTTTDPSSSPSTAPVSSTAPQVQKSKSCSRYKVIKEFYYSTVLADDVVVGDVTAISKNGILTITLPKAAAVNTSHTIPVTSS
jgi:HSP20 family molecular chaperone IbpA